MIGHAFCFLMDYNWDTCQRTSAQWLGTHFVFFMDYNRYTSVEEAAANEKKRRDFLPPNKTKLTFSCLNRYTSVEEAAANEKKDGLSPA